jgi:ABC-type sugar transport system permease subunit
VKKKRFKLKMRHRRAIAGLIFILPWIIGFAWFYAGSLFTSVRLSLSSIEVGAGGAAGYVAELIGFENYRFALMDHGSFRQIFASSFLNMFVDVPLIIFFSLFVAILLNQAFKGRAFFRAIFFLPVILNSDAITNALNMARAFMVGGVTPASAAMTDAAGAGSGINMQYYITMFISLGLPAGVMEYLVGAVERINLIVTSSGVQIIIFIAALQAIPKSLYEVSRIEGATSYETFWKVTFPLVTPLIITNLVYTVIDSFAKSEIVQLSYSTIFSEYNFALGSVMSLLSTVAVCGLLLFVCRIISKRTFYHN